MNLQELAVKNSTFSTFGCMLWTQKVISYVYNPTVVIITIMVENVSLEVHAAPNVGFNCRIMTRCWWKVPARSLTRCINSSVLSSVSTSRSESCCLPTH
jgi:hypothetical protein